MKYIERFVRGLGVVFVSVLLACAITARADEVSLPVATALPTKTPDYSLAIVQCNQVVVIYLIVDGEVYVYDKSSTVDVNGVKLVAQVARKQEVRWVPCDQWSE